MDYLTLLLPKQVALAVQLEPIVEVYKPGEEKLLCKDEPFKSKRIINEHVMKGKIIQEYTVGAEEK